MANINNFGFPFSSVAGDRQYGASEWRTYFESLVTSGVTGDILNELSVEPQDTPNKTVYVDTGSIFIKGALFELTSAENLTIADNTSGSARIDRIVARLNYTDRKIEFAVLQGTPSASPVVPTLTRSTATWELSLAQIAVANGFSTITATEITDERLDESVCGFAKTIYMETFDDENNLLKYKRDVISVDGTGFPTRVDYDRYDNTLFLKILYSNADANGWYQTITETYHETDGTTVYKTIVYTLTYLASGAVDTWTRVVN